MNGRRKPRAGRMARVRARGRRVACLVAVALAAAIAGLATVTMAGPVESYREGRAYCPHDRATGARTLAETEVEARAVELLPGFCGPSTFVSGCFAEPELINGTWRVYVRQYKLVGREREFGGLDHSYVILDAVGNCVANIPGTPLGALH